VKAQTITEFTISKSGESLLNKLVSPRIDKEFAWRRDGKYGSNRAKERSRRGGVCLAKKVIFYPMLRVLFGYVDILPTNTGVLCRYLYTTGKCPREMFIYILFPSPFPPSNHCKPRNLSAVNVYDSRVINRFYS